MLIEDGCSESTRIASAVVSRDTAAAAAAEDRYLMSKLTGKTSLKNKEGNASAGQEGGGGNS